MKARHFGDPGLRYGAGFLGTYLLGALSMVILTALPQVEPPPPAASTAAETGVEDGWTVVGVTASGHTWSLRDASIKRGVIGGRSVVLAEAKRTSGADGRLVRIAVDASHCGKPRGDLLFLEGGRTHALVFDLDAKPRASAADIVAALCRRGNK